MRDLVNVCVFMNKFILAENPSSRELFDGTSSFLTFVLTIVCLFCVSSMSCTLPASNIISKHLLIPATCLHASLCLFFTWAAFHCWRLLFCSGLSNFVQLFLAFLSQALECFLLLTCICRSEEIQLKTLIPASAYNWGEGCKQGFKQVLFVGFCSIYLPLFQILHPDFSGHKAEPPPPAKYLELLYF